MPKKEEKREITGGQIIRATWKIVSIGISILMLLVFSMIFFSIMGSFAGPVMETGNIAVIPIEGMITTNDEGLMPGTKSSTTVNLLEEAQKNDEIKAIILEIDSPGGTPVATDEIATAVKNANKTVLSVIRESGASGAFWIATAADRVYANRMSVTGSIGVQASRLEFGGLIADYNITYRQLTAGRLKDAGSRFRDMTPEEQQLFQRMLDNLHTEFIRTVAQNRNLPEDYVRGLATGFVYLGAEAKELGLIDEIGGKKEALKYLEQTLNITAEPVEFKEHKTFFDSLSSFTSEQARQLGKGIGSTLMTPARVTLT
jgi:protease-4